MLVSNESSVENESRVLTMFACRFFLADWDQRATHTKFEIRAPIATMSATCMRVSIPPSFTTLVLVSPKVLQLNQITLLHNEEDN